MFTGIVEETGQVLSIQKGGKSTVLEIKGNIIFKDMKLGDSIAVNGVCLTVTRFNHHSFTADVMNETLSRSNLGDLKTGAPVNLERAMAADGRFGGHIVSGHIDGTGTILEVETDDNAVWYTIATSPSIMRYIIEKGSVTIDGISLTVAKLTGNSFSVSVIPHTRAVTILASKSVGDTVNLENDIIGKYVERLLAPPAVKESTITRDFLRRAGF